MTELFRSLFQSTQDFRNSNTASTLTAVEHLERFGASFRR